MAIKRIRQTAGLHTDVSPLDAPEGALRQADNVLLHRPGIIQPRPGFGDTTGVASRTTDRRPIAMWPFDGDVVVQSYDGSSAWAVEKLSADTQYDSTRTPPDTAIRGSSDHAIMRGSLYVTTDAGIHKLTGASASSLVSAGVPQDYAPIVSSVVTGPTGDRWAIDADNAVAYRYCWVSEDANGYLRRSAPSARWELASASKAWVFFDRIYIPSGLAAGDRLEVYRTKGSGSATTTPGTEYYLSTSYVLTGADVSQGYIDAETVIDDQPDTALGQVLYTSASQGGIAVSNERPPLANSLAEWAGCLWLGNTQQRHSVTAEITAVYDSTASDWDASGLHYSERTATATGGSPTLTALSGVDGLKEGQYVTDSTDGPTQAGTAVAALTTINSITTKLTAATINSGDTIDILGETFTFQATPSGTTDVQIGGTDGDSMDNLAAKLDGWDFNDSAGHRYSISASNASTTVSITDGYGGRGIEVSETGGSVTIAYEVGLSANATGSGAIAVTVHDSIVIDSVRFFTWADDVGGKLSDANISSATYRLFGVNTSTAGSETNVDLQSEAADQLAAAVNAYALTVDTAYNVRAYRDTEQEFGPARNRGAVTFLRATPDGGTFSVDSDQRPEAFRPHLDSIDSEDTQRRGRVYYSKPDEPEAVPFTNWIDVGDPRSDVLALVGLDDALLAWKEDGLYRITGSAPSSWVVDEVRSGRVPLRLVAPEAVTVLDNTCFAWTNRGVVATAGAGFEPVSGPIADTLRELQRSYPVNDTGAKRGAFMEAHPRLGFVALWYADSTSDDYSDGVYVFPVGTGRWSKWTRADRCAAYDPAEDRMLVSPGVDGWEVLYERSDEDAAASYRDVSVSSLGSVSRAFDGSTLTIPQSEFDPWTPDTCDLVEITGDGDPTYHQVTAVTTSGSDYVLTISPVAPGGFNTYDWHQGYACTLLWQAQHAAGMGHRWQELHAEFGSVTSEYLTTATVDMGGAAHRDASPSSVEATITPTVTYSEPVRTGLPRACVRTPQLYPYLQVCSAGLLWELTHLYVHHTPTSRRVRR